MTVYWQWQCTIAMYCYNDQTYYLYWGRQVQNLQLQNHMQLIEILGSSKDMIIIGTTLCVLRASSAG